MRINRWGIIGMLGLLNGCAPAVIVRETQDQPIRVFAETNQVQPGHALRITARVGIREIQFCAEGWGQTAGLYGVPGMVGDLEGFLALPLTAEPGPAEIKVYSLGEPAAVHTIPIEVVPRPRDRTSRLSIRNFSRLPYGRESGMMAAARKKAGGYPGPRLESWPWPVGGRLSERFGVRRIYNGGQGSWAHGGYDIAAPGGTPVKAPAHGRVIFTAPFEAHGNTILIDHGYGVVTTYLHLRAIHVTAGEEVRLGQVIGEVGSTGGSTADHLHFQINVNGRTVEPADFLREAGS